MTFRPCTHCASRRPHGSQQLHERQPGPAAPQLGEKKQAGAACEEQRGRRAGTRCLARPAFHREVHAVHGDDVVAAVAAVGRLGVVLRRGWHCARAHTRTHGRVSGGRPQRRCGPRLHNRMAAPPTGPSPGCLRRGLSGLGLDWGSQWGNDGGRSVRTDQDASHLQPQDREKQGRRACWPRCGAPSSTAR